MRSLAPPSRAAADDLRVCIDRSRADVRQAFSDAEQDILQLFAGYVAQRGWDPATPQDTDHVPPEVHDAARRSYGLTYTGRALADLRKDILGRGDGMCPFCRLIKATTLDHFLPKSSNGLFASFAPNLVPMCAECNTLKGTRGSNVARQFFTHSYFDDLPADVPFLVAQVAVGEHHVATNFTIDFSTGLDADLYQRLAFQMSVLRLVERYQRESVDVILEQAGKLAYMADGEVGAEGRRASLEGDAANLASLHGASHWHSALLVALSTNSDFYGDGFRKVL